MTRGTAPEFGTADGGTFLCGADTRDFLAIRPGDFFHRFYEGSEDWVSAFERPFTTNARRNGFTRRDRGLFRTIIETRTRGRIRERGRRQNHDGDE